MAFYSQCYNSNLVMTKSCTQPPLQPVTTIVGSVTAVLSGATEAPANGRVQCAIEQPAGSRWLLERLRGPGDATHRAGGYRTRLQTGASLTDPPGRHPADSFRSRPPGRRQTPAAAVPALLNPKAKVQA